MNAGTQQQVEKKPMAVAALPLNYVVVYDRIRQLICDKQLNVGDRVPSERKLAAELGVHAQTVRKGLNLLAKEKLIERRVGSGTFVTGVVAKGKPIVSAGKDELRIAVLCRQYMLEMGKNHPTIGAYMAGMHERSEKGGVCFQPMFYKKDHLVGQLGQKLLDQKIDGVIVMDGGATEQDYDFFKKHGIAVVDCQGLVSPGLRTGVVVNDESRLIQAVIEHLRGLGHNRIGFLKYTSSPTDASYRAFVDQVYHHRLGDPRELVTEIRNPRGQLHWEDVGVFFDMVPLPTAVIVPDEWIADVLLSVCDRRSIDVPGDLSVVALCDMFPYGHRIPITAPESVTVVKDKIFKACDLLVKLVKNEEISEKTIQIIPELVMKASSGPVRSLPFNN